MLCLHARAKINWSLDILGVREDGYHLMDMLMQSVSVCDTLWLEKADELTLESAGCAAVSQSGYDAFSAKAVPFDEQNLVFRAARALKVATGCHEGARIRLAKRIPSGAGMGGGSADAAAALIGLNTLWQLGLTSAALHTLGLSLGADVPFMLQGGLARVGGIGEQITPLHPAPQIWLVLLQPCDGLSTKEIFSAFDALDPGALPRPLTPQAQDALLSGDLPALACGMGNVLEAVSAIRRPAIAQAVRALEAYGAIRAMMTGSGSVVYGIFANQAEAESAQINLKERYPYCAVCATESAGIVNEA